MANLAPSFPAPSVPLARPLLVRLASLLALGLLLTAVLWLVHAAWRAASDAFVAPLSLSPDSALVLDGKLRLTELELERARARAEAEQAAAELAAADAEIAELDGLRRTVSAAAPWTQNLQSVDALTGAAQLQNAAQQAGVLSRMIAKQQKITETARQNLEAGVINRLDYEREEQRLDQLALASLEAARSRVDSESAVRKVQLGQRSLAGGAPPMPEMVAREDLSVRLGLQLLRLEAKKAAQLAAHRALLERVSKLEELIAHLKRLPLYQAVETQLDVAFVPYTKLKKVRPGDLVLRCTLVVFGCHQVGVVSSLLPGEVTQPDPWGTTERGQYALLTLSDRSAAWARTLRVRGGG